MVKKLRRTQIAVKTLDLRLTRVSHLRRLISPLGTGNWRFSAPNMPFLLQPWHILLAALCGMVNERQQQIIQFQNAQIEALLKKLGKICTESWSFCGEGARSVETDTDLLACGPIVSTTFDRYRESIRSLTPDC